MLFLKHSGKSSGSGQLEGGADAASPTTLSPCPTLAHPERRIAAGQYRCVVHFPKDDRKPNGRYLLGASRSSGEPPPHFGCRSGNGNAQAEAGMLPLQRELPLIS